MLVKSPNDVRALGSAGFIFFEDIVPPSDESASAFFLVHLEKQNISYLCLMAEFQSHLKQTLISTI
jgi:hypothetical protein